MTPEQLKVILSAEDRTAAAFAAVRQSTDKLGLNFKTLGATAASALAALSVPVSAAGLVQVFNSARRAVDGLKDLQDATGASIENISALDSIARSTGANIDTVGAALVKFNGVLKDAEAGRGAGQIIEALGLSLQQLQRQDPAEALRAVAVALKGFADDGAKARAVQELFGKSVREVAPFLNDLAEARGLDAKLTAQQVEQMDRFNKEVARLAATGEDAWRSAATEIAGGINRIIDRLREAQKQGSLFWEIMTLTSPAALAGSALAGLVGSSPAGRREVSGSITDLTQESMAEKARLARQAGPRSLSLPPLPAPTGGNRPRASASAAEDPILADYRRQAAVLAQLAKDDEERWKRSGEAARRSLQAQGEEQQALLQANADYQRELDNAGRALTEATRTPQERLIASLSEIDRLQQAGAVSAETAGRAIADAYREAARAASELTEEQVAAQRQAADFSSAFSAAANAVLFDSARAGDAVRALAGQIARLVIQRQVIEPAADGIGRFLSNLIPRASGGLVSAGTPYLVGELGREVFVPEQNGSILPNSALGASGGIVINNQIDARGADPSVLNRLPAILEAQAARTKADILAALNRGGSFARAAGRA